MAKAVRDGEIGADVLEAGANLVTTRVHIGIPFTSVVETLPPALITREGVSLAIKASSIDEVILNFVGGLPGVGNDIDKTPTRESIETANYRVNGVRRRPKVPCEVRVDLNAPILSHQYIDFEGKLDRSTVIFESDWPFELASIETNVAFNTA